MCQHSVIRRLTLTIYTPLTTLCFKINFIHGPLSQLDCFSLGKIPISREFVRVWDCANLGDAGDSLNNCKSHCCHNPGSGSGHIGGGTINLRTSHYHIEKLLVTKYPPPPETCLLSTDALVTRAEDKTWQIMPYVLSSADHGVLIRNQLCMRK